MNQIVSNPLNRVGGVGIRLFVFPNQLQHVDAFFHSFIHVTLQWHRVEQSQARTLFAPLSKRAF